MKKKPKQDEWVSELVEAAESAVIGYEKYFDITQIFNMIASFVPNITI